MRFRIIQQACGLFLVLGGLVSCSSVSPRQITLEQDAYVTDSEQTAKFYPRGSQIQMRFNSYTLIESPGHLSILVPPASNLPDQVKVSLKPVEGWGEEVVSKRVDKQVAEVFFQINEIQSLIAKKDGSTALAKIRFLEERSPHLFSLKYLKITALLALNRKDEARQVFLDFKKDLVGSEAGARLLELMNKEKGQRIPASVCPGWTVQNERSGEVQ